MPRQSSTHRRSWLDPDDDRLLAAHQRLIDQRIIAPLAEPDHQVQRWLAWELASIIEGHLHQIVDVNVLAPVERFAWERRVIGKGERLVDPRTDEFRRAYWLLDGDEGVGTLAIDSQRFGRSEVGISSLYVRPELRGRGIARRALEAVHEAVVIGGASGLLISTSWCWQHAVRFYARLGLWVRNWKHSLVFVRGDDLWPYRIEIDGINARYDIYRDTGWAPLLQAQHCGVILNWTELPASAVLGDARHHAHTLAPGTFALHLALNGWPLVRSAALWARRHDWSDLGMPEGLAHKITVFEDISRVVST